MRRLIALALACCICQGCFALDEIDKGQKELQRYSPRAREAANAKAEQRKAEAENEEGWLERAGQLAGDVKAWWTRRSERTPERDPDDVPVPCDIRGQLQFMRKSDCVIRGGIASS